MQSVAAFSEAVVMVAWMFVVVSTAFALLIGVAAVWRLVWRRLVPKSAAKVLPMVRKDRSYHRPKGAA